MKRIIVGLLFLTACSLFAESPGKKLLWDLSHGPDNDPLTFYRYGSQHEGAADHYGDFTVEMIRKFRELYPRQVTLPSQLDGKILIARSQQEMDTFVAMGTFPDVKVDRIGREIKGEAYITLTFVGLENVELEQYDSLLISVATSYLKEYTKEHAKQVRNFVDEGGHLLLFGENFWTPRKNVKSLFNAFGYDLSMGLTQRWTKFEGIYAGLSYVRSDGGAWLCPGKAAGWHLSYADSRRVERLTDGFYKRKLMEYRWRFSGKPYAKLCKEKRQLGNENFIPGVIVNQTTKDDGPYEAKVHVYGDIGEGRVWLFADGSFAVNHIMAKVPGNVQFIANLMDQVLK